MAESSSTPTAATPSSRLLFFGWLICALFFFYAFVQRVAPSVMVDELMRDFAVGGAVLGNLSAFYYYAYAGLQIPVGVLMDRIGPRRLVSLALALVGVGSLVFAMADSLWLAYFGRLLIGTGCAFSFVGALNYAAMWFPPNRFATLSGWAQMLGVFGGIMGQAPLGIAVETIGWRPMLAGFAVLGLGLAVAAAITLRDKPREGPAGGGGMLVGLKRCMRNSQTWLAAGFGMAMTGTMLAFAGLWGVPYMMVAHGLEKASAAGLVSLLFVGWGFGAPVWGLLADRFSRRRILMAIGALIATIGITSAVYLPGLPVSVVAVILVFQGFGASSMVLCFAVARENNPAWTRGAALGIVNGLVVGSGAILQPILGWVLDLEWDGAMQAGARIYGVEAYETAFLVLPVTCLIGVGLALLVRETHGVPYEDRLPERPL